MPSIFDTPPDGDFARYVDRLTQQSAARLRVQSAATAGVRHVASGSPSTGAASWPNARLPRSATGVPLGKGGPGVGAAPAVEPALLQAMAPLWRVAKWAVLAWIAYTVAALLVASVAVLAWPLLLGFLVWAVVVVRRTPWAAVAQGLQRAAQRAQEGAGSAR